MDHSHHAGMDHSHMDHGDMGHDMPMCSMNVSYPHPTLLIYKKEPPTDVYISHFYQMLFTWDTTNLCIVFPSWRITGPLSLIVSLLAVVALTAGYEAIREVSRRYEEKLAANVRDAPRKFHPPNSPVFVVCCRQARQGKARQRRWCFGLYFLKKKALLTHFYFLPRKRRCRTKLTPYYYGRQCRCGGREEGQDAQGRAVWRAGVLFVLHHVSFLFLH
jgi:hypothetical protein